MLVNISLNLYLSCLLVKFYHLEMVSFNNDYILT